MTGVLATIIMFTMLFTVLFGFLIYNNVVNLQNTKASDQRQAEVQQQSAENLVLGVGFKSAPDPWGQTGDLWLVVNNTGGVCTSIVDVYVTSVASSTLVSNSLLSGGNYLSAYSGAATPKGDLNLNLPLSISAGASTGTMTNCGSYSDPYGCDIAISMSAFKWVPGMSVQVSVVTSTGNIFSAAYPPNRPTITGFAANPPTAPVEAL